LFEVVNETETLSAKIWCNGARHEVESDLSSIAGIPAAPRSGDRGYEQRLKRALGLPRNDTPQQAKDSLNYLTIAAALA